jgi:hypothetical protein
MFKCLVNGLDAGTGESDDPIPQTSESPFEASGHKAFIFHNKDAGGAIHGHGITLLGRLFHMTLSPAVSKLNAIVEINRWPAA